MAKQVKDDNKFTDTRLPTNLKPVHYDLWLKPNFDNFTFAGKVQILYESNDNEKVDSVVIHSTELEILDGSIMDSSSSADSRNSLIKVVYSESVETATLEFESTIASKGVLELNFKGKLEDKMKGFYRTAIKLGDKTLYAASTQFAPTDARRCFPCWDEPAIKATFTLSVVINKFINDTQFERTVLSNMLEDSRTGPDNETVVKFNKSPVMSTYLLALCVGPFEMIEGTDGCRPTRLITTPGKKSQGQFALEVATKALSFYEDYFKIPYPLPKMDLIAVPDLSYGAMENWGLVTFRETAILVDPSNTSTTTKQRVALTIAHEIAHQWFGNLVTMEWWTHLWLNEGFASFMEYLCIDYIFPEYDVWSQFVSDVYCLALDLDALDNSHPIEVEVQNSAEIDEIFDIISYKKGASILRMLYTHIGDKNFRVGMKDYLTKFAYKNTATEDLWDCLGAASGESNLKDLMSAWTGRKGFPWLSVTYELQQGDKIKLKFTQSKFSANGKLAAEEVNQADSNWVIPIIATSAQRSNFPVCILDKESGFYRCAYPEEIIRRLKPAISNQSLHFADRLGVQNDFFALCKAGKIQTVDWLRLLLAYKDETEYTVWSSIDNNLGSLAILLSNTNYQHSFDAFCRQLYSKVIEKLSWTSKANEKTSVSLTRALVISRLVSCGDETVVKEALRRFKVHVDTGAAIEADLRYAIYKAVSMFGDDDLFGSLFKICKNAEMQEEKNRVAQALGLSCSKKRRADVVNFVLSNEVRNQDKVSVISKIGLVDPTGTWQLFQDKKDMFKEIYGSGLLMANLVKFVTTNLASEQRAQEVEKFFDVNKFPGSERSVRQSLEVIRLKANWLARDGEAIEKFLLSQ